MKFYGQRMGNPAHDDRPVVDELMDWLKQSDFDSPNHLKSEVEKIIANNKLAWTCSLQSGALNIHAPNGIILRMRSNT